MSVIERLVIVLLSQNEFLELLNKKCTILPSDDESTQKEKTKLMAILMIARAEADLFELGEDELAEKLSNITIL